MTGHARPLPESAQEAAARRELDLKVAAALMNTKGSKAWVAALLAFVTSMLGTLLLLRMTGAHWDADLILNAFYLSLTGSGITGGATYIKTNKPK